MNDFKNSSSESSLKNSWINTIRNINLQPYFTGIFPLFVFAHFGHHVVSAMTRPLTPMIRTGLGISYTQIGYMQMAFGLTTGLSQLPAGRIADHFGARLMVLLGVTGVAIAGFFIGLSNSFAMLVTFMVLSALLGSGYHPASAAAISSSVPKEYLGRTLGIHLIGGTCSFWMVPLLAAPIAAKWDWHMPYMILTIPIAILGIVLYTLIGKHIRARNSRQRQSVDSEKLTPQAKINWGKLVPFIAISVLTGTMVQSVSAYLSLYATDVLFVSEETAAMLMSITPAVGLFAAPLGGYISDLFGSLRVIIAVSFIAVPLVYLIGRAPSVTTFIILMIALGLLTNTRMPTSESYISSNTPEYRRATVLGVYYFAGTGVSAPLAPIIGNLIERLGFPRTFSIASVVIGITATICSLFMWKNMGYKKYPST